MPRPPRLEFPGALYHITARGIQRRAIFADDRDRASFLTILSRALHAYDACAFAFCLMSNHHHLVLQTRLANVSLLMQRINGDYSQTFNRRHDRRGPLFESRFAAVHVDREAYLLEVCRYVDLNPVRAGLVESPAQWAWSSYRAHVGTVAAPPWLATEPLLAGLAGLTPRNVDEAAAARRRYAEWVEAGRAARLWKTSLRHGCYLGDEAFVERVRQQAG